MDRFLQKAMIRFDLSNMSDPVNLKQSIYFGISRRIVIVFAALCALSACGAPVAKGEFNDPYESSSRNVHTFNKAFDKAVYMVERTLSREEF